MRLVLQLVGRLLLVVALCLGATTLWATIDAYRSVDRATEASAQRVALAMEALYWRELLLRSSRMREHLVPVADWRNIETMKLISPGVCVQFEPVREFEKPLCGQSKGIGLALFSASLQTMKTLGHAYAFIGDAGPVDFYAKTAGAVPIPAPDKGVYEGMLRSAPKT